MPSSLKKSPCNRALLILCAAISSCAPLSPEFSKGIDLLTQASSILTLKALLEALQIIVIIANYRLEMSYVIACLILLSRTRLRLSTWKGK